MSNEKRLNKHSIRDIEINRGSSGLTTRKRRAPKRVARTTTRPKKRSGSKLTFIASVFLFLSISFLLYAFLKPSSATVEIQAKVKKVPLSDDYIHIAYKEAEPGQLAFKVVEYNFTKFVTLNADKEEYSEEKASGLLTVYNDYSSKPQRIIRNTRFQSPDGKIYRVKKPFTIPGKSSAGPGKIDVKVYADEAGQKYNLKSGIKFTLPALTGEAAKEIYAVSKTDISGGFSGKRATVSEEKKRAAIEQLKNTLKETALKQAILKLGDNYISFKDAIIVDYDDPTYEYKNGKLVISLKAKAYIPAFDKYDFARELLSAADAELDFDNNNKIYISNLEDLDLRLINKDSLDIKEDEILKFTAKGQAVAKYYLDKEVLKLELAGKNKTVVNFVKEAYPAIDRISAVIKPFWRDSFPKDPSKIQIVEIEP